MATPITTEQLREAIEFLKPSARATGWFAKSPAELVREKVLLIETAIAQRDERIATLIKCVKQAQDAAIEIAANNVKLEAEVKRLRESMDADEVSKLSAAHYNLQSCVWASMSKYSDKLGWGLTGLQPECWIMLDSAVDELIKSKDEVKRLREALQFYDRNYVLVSFKNEEGQYRMIGNFGIVAKKALAPNHSEKKA